MDAEHNRKWLFAGWIVVACAIALSMAISTIPTVVFFVYQDNGGANWIGSISNVASYLSSCSNQTSPTTSVGVLFGIVSFGLHFTIMSNCLTAKSNQSVHEQNVCSI